MDDAIDRTGRDLTGNRHASAAPGPEGGSPRGTTEDWRSGVRDDVVFDDRFGMGRTDLDPADPGPLDLGSDEPEPAGHDPDGLGSDGAASEPGASRRSPVRSAIEWGAIILGAFLIAFVVKTFLLQAFYIPSESMLPTLAINDRVLVNKLSYDLHDVNRGDVIVFERPPGEADGTVKDLIKRVIALPNETVEARDGRVYVDDQLLEEPYLPEGTVTDNLTRLTVPPGHVFVMGDNRGDSRDSRFFGPIDQALIVGRAFVRVWPLNHLDTL